MSSVPDHPIAPSGSDDGEAALADLRTQLQAMRERMEDQRSQMRAVGLTREDPGEAPEG